MALSFIKSSGNIITEDFCLSIANETKVEFVKDKSFGPDMKRVDEVIASTFEKLRERWEENRSQIIVNELDNAALRKKWIIPFFEALSFQPVFVSSNIKSESGTEYQIPYKAWDSEYAPLIHMVHSSQDFDGKDKTSRTHSNKSPQDCLQQFLNTSHHQWAILINGKKVRVLRDFYHSITKGFLEFDIESIFETANSEQFRVLFRILHRSRLENQYQGKQEIEYDEEGIPIEVEDNCLLESFHKKSRETGVKVGNKLRDQVIEAIEKLGNGFAESLNPDEFQNGKVKAYYAEILNIIYRLLFLMFAEQKGWLPVRNSIYARTYSLNALREMAERGNYSHDEEHDLWEGLKITFKLVANGYEFKNGDKINAFGGQLFSDKKIAVIKDLSLKNKFLLDAIFRLSYFKLDNLSNRINYANLAIDELGSVYESLLDYEPKLARETITLGKREIKRGEFYLDDRGTDRKTTGSYYTDSRLVAQLIESALVPVIKNSLEGKNSIEAKEKALLDLKVADIACGSGAFICAALEKLGEELALIRMGDEERPTEDQLREAKRDVLLHCIYGVDLNPMALELAKFSLWITASLPDMPLTFLDHKLKCGNSLVGATPDLIKKGIPEEAFKAVGNDNPDICNELKKRVRKQLESMNRVNEPTIQYGMQFKRNETDELFLLREKLNNRKQEDTGDVDLAEEEYHQLEKMERRFKDWLMADVWTASFFIEKTELDYDLYPTNVTLENLKENQPVNEILIERVLQTADQYNFFHYHLEFPEVFEKGGFDCLLGNPPWEGIKLKETEFFSGKNESIANSDNKNLRVQLINALKGTDPELYLLFMAAKDHKAKENNYYLKSGRYPLLGRGDLDLYFLFTEIPYNAIKENGRAGIIVPTGIATSDTTKHFFDWVVSNKNLVSLYDFENKHGLFKDVHKEQRFCLLTLTKKVHSEPIRFAFFVHSPEELLNADKIINLFPEDIITLNPNTKNCPIIRNSEDKSILLKIYHYSKILINEENNDDSWLITTMFHMSNDSHLFNYYSTDLDLNNYVPVYEGKNTEQYNHRYGTFMNSSKTDLENGNCGITSNVQYSDTNYEIVTRYWISREDFETNVSQEKLRSFYLTFHGISNPNNQRTFTGTICPNVSFGNSIPVILFKDANCAVLASLLLANFNSFVFDYVSRLKMGGRNFNFFVVKQLPIIPEENYSSKLKEIVIKHAAKLSFTSNSLKAYGSELGVDKPYQWNEKERFQLECELDAIYAHLYGLEKVEMNYILETFPIVKRKDIAKYGTYRTKETILQLYDEFTWVKDEIKQQPIIKTENA